MQNIVFMLTTVIVVAKGQNMPVFMGPNTSAVRPNFGSTNQFRPTNRGPPPFRGPVGGPQFPGSPRGPGPVRPMGPVRPLGPMGSVGPRGPIGAVRPVGPMGSVGPGGPMGAVRPVGPMGSAGPRGPLGAVRPVGPVSPVGPMGPIRPIGQTGPTLAVGPIGPVGGSGPVSPQQQQERSRWAPGEPKWVFPSTPQQWRNSCQRTGCSQPGTQCVFWGGLCPTSVRRTPCRCERGCKVDDVFIPFGQSKVMDSCNNICACYSREGLASCTARRC